VKKALLFSALVLLASACGPIPAPVLENSRPSAEPSATIIHPGEVPEIPPDEDSIAPNVRVDDPTEYSFAQLLPFDGIAPVYDPEFVPAAQSPLLDEELVIGVTLDGEAKAYPITVLRFREMVNDEMAGIPTLVTW
jgi:hypothetical protein